MDDIALTPVERGILFVLMAHNQPLTQAGLQKGHGLGVKKNHRLKLQALGLIEVTVKPAFTLALTKKGWAWLEAELTAPKPAGSRGLGPLYAVLGVVSRLTKRLGLPLEEALGPDGSAPKPADTEIRQPEWIEVDEVACPRIAGHFRFFVGFVAFKGGSEGGAGK